MRDSSNWKLEVVYQKMKRKLQCSQGNTQGPERSSDYYSRPSGPSEPGGWRRRSPSQILTGIETKSSPWKALCCIVNMSCSFHNSLGLILAPPPAPLDSQTFLRPCYSTTASTTSIEKSCYTGDASNTCVWVGLLIFHTYVTAFSKGFFLLPSFGLCCRTVVMYFWPFPPFYFLW